jgi:hypothetical protein
MRVDDLGLGRTLPELGARADRHHAAVLEQQRIGPGTAHVPGADARVHDQA